MTKATTMQDAVRELVRDGDTVAIEGFTHLICFAAGHEIIRQRRRDLTLARMTPDVIYDQMIGAGVASKMIFSWMGNPGVGNLHAARRRIEHADPAPLEIEEYSHFGMVCRYMAGAANLPFFPIRSYYESDIPKVNPKIVPMTSPYDEADEVYVVPPLRPDVAIVHAQRADVDGDTQIWGLLGCQKEVAFAARQRDRGRGGDRRGVGDPARPEPDGDPRARSSTRSSRSRSPATRRSRRATTTATTRFYLEWDRIAKQQDTLDAWLDEWVYGLAEPRASTSRSTATRTGIGLRPAPRRAARSTTGGTRERRRPELGYSKSELMIAASARQLGGVSNCFVGVGLPNIVCNLAQRTVAPELQLVYESGVFGARPERLPLSIGDPTLATGSTAVTSMFELFAFYLQAGLIDVAFLGGRPDRPPRQPQHHGDRRLRRADRPPAGIRGRLRDRDPCPPDPGDHAAGATLVRGAARLPHLTGAQRRSSARRRPRVARQRPHERGDRSRDLLVRRRLR